MNKRPDGAEHAAVWPGCLPILADDRVELHMITEDDRAALAEIAFDPRIWRYFVVRVAGMADFDAMIDAALGEQRADTRMCYVVVDRAGDSAGGADRGCVAGSMSYLNMRPAEGRLEIGWSWLGCAFWGRGVNRHAKGLLLAQAFDRLGAERVEFKTDARNQQARSGLRNIGAVEEGTLRSYNPMPDGHRRDAVFYSVLRPEWPALQPRLLMDSPVATKS